MRNLLPTVLLLISPWSFASGSFVLPWYAAGSVERQSISLTDEKFQPVVGSVVLGAWLYEGIGLEAELGTNLQEDNIATLAVESETQFSVGVRLQSPPINNIAAFALFSASSVSIASRFTSGNPDKETHNFSGVRGIFGLSFPVLRKWEIDAAYVSANYGDDFRVNGFRIGARYTINNVRPRKRRGWLQ